MSKFLKLFVAIFLVVSCSKKEETPAAEDYNLTITSQDGNKSEFMVEDALTPQELEHGLMGRESLSPKSGMIFDLHNYKNAAMWMKDTKIPLDMIFIKNNKIVWIYENAQPMSTETIICPEEFDSVIEINAGEVKEYNIKVGDMVEHDFFSNGTAAEPAEQPIEGPVPEEFVEDGEEIDIEEAEMPSDEETTPAPAE